MSQLPSVARFRWLEEAQRGFRALLPLWPATLPSGMTFALVAHVGGWSSVETLLAMLCIFSGSIQATLVTLQAQGLSLGPILGTAVLLNLRNTLYGFSLAPRLPSAPRVLRAITAFFLTDESFGITANASQASVAYLLGTGVSQYVCYAIGAVMGIALGSLLQHPQQLGLDFLFPLLYITLLLARVRTWRQGIVAGMAALVTFFIGSYFPPGAVILMATLLAVPLSLVQLPQEATRGTSR